MAGPAGNSEAAMSGTTAKLSYKQALEKSTPAANRVVAPASSAKVWDLSAPPSSPKIHAHREMCLNYGSIILPRNSKRGCALQLLEHVGEIVVGTKLSNEDLADLSDFRQRLKKTSNHSIANIVSAHVAQAARHLKAALELAMLPEGNDSVMPADVKLDDDCKAALTQRIFEDDACTSDDHAYDACKAALTQCPLRDEGASSEAQSMSDDEDSKERLTKRFFGAEPVHSDVYEEDVLCKELLTQRLFGHETLPEVDPGVDADEQCKQELTQRLFGRDHVSYSFSGRPQTDELEELRNDLTQRLFGRDHVSTSFRGSDIALIAAVKGAQSSCKLSRRWADLF